MHWPDAYRIALGVVGDRAAAEDVAQEGLLSAIRSLDRFDHRRPFGPWLHRIVTNRALDWVRTRARRAEVELGEHGQSIPASRLAEPGAGGLGADLTAALGSLAVEERTVIVLRHVLAYSPVEIARLLDRAPATVRSQLHRGLKRLRALIEDPSQPARPKETANE